MRRYLSSVLGLIFFVQFVLACFDSVALANVARTPTLNLMKNSKEWSVSRINDYQVFLEHSSKKKYVFIMEYNSTIKKSDGEKYLRTGFVRDAKLARNKELEFYGSPMSGLTTSSALQNSKPFGASSFNVTLPEGSALFTERVWVEDSKVWQIVMVSFGSFTGLTQEHNAVMSDLMAQISQHQKVSGGPLWKFIFDKTFPEAEAEVATVGRATNRVGTAVSQTLSEVLFPLPTEKECTDPARKIKPENLGRPPYGPRFEGSSWNNCLQGSEDALKKLGTKIKNSPGTFLNAIDRPFRGVHRYADVYLKKENYCPDIGDAPTTIAESFADPYFKDPKSYRSRVKAMQDCVNNAYSLGSIDEIKHIGVVTSNYLAKFGHWLVAHRNPADMLLAVCGSADRVMCLNARAQEYALCECATTVLATTGASFVTGGVISATAVTVEAVTAGKGLVEAFSAGTTAARTAVISRATAPVQFAKASVRNSAMAAEIIKKATGVQAEKKLADRSVASLEASVKMPTPKKNIVMTAIQVIRARRNSRLAEIDRDEVVELLEVGEDLAARHEAHERAERRRHEAESEFERQSREMPNSAAGH